MKYTKKQEWMQKFEEITIDLRPDLSGKIDWNSANYNYYIGKTPVEAAKLYLTNH